MKEVLNTDNWKVGWTEVGNYTIHNKTTEQSMTIPRSLLKDLFKELFE